MQDPYAQNKAELIARKLHENPQLVLSQAVLYRGKLDGVLDTVRNLQHKCGFPEKSYQVKFNGDIEALRLSDYFTRHVCEPGDYFWMLGDVIMGGDMASYAAITSVYEFVRGWIEEPGETSMPAQVYAIVTALKRLRLEARK